MTETQRRFLTEYLWECWHEYDKSSNLYNRCTCGAICGNLAEHIKESTRTFATAQDKQDLLEKIDKKHEWKGFISHCVENEEFSYKWLILLCPLATAELICKWKGVE